ncbi:MAG TPA: hypothetical protein VN554_00810 [Verrucomicrobiae bacterium]|nr:hypothetical protein [Verrucomicrobiae bacterium]
MNPSAPDQPDAPPQLARDIVVPAGMQQYPAQRYAAQQMAGRPEEAIAPTPPPPPQPTPPPAPPAQTVVPTAPPPQAPAAPVPAPPAIPKGGAAKVGADKPKPQNNSTQNSLQIAEIRDGIVIMNDGSFRSVIMVKSINFDLMSPQEQEAVEYSYQGFLNSLFFPVQIFLRSQKVDIRPYIDKLDRIRSEHDNMLLAMLMEDYIGYIAELSQQTNIMDKKFYVVIPYFPVVEAQQALTRSKNFLGGVGGLFSKAEQHVVINEATLEDAKTELRNRVQSVLGGLEQCGVKGLPLDTQELIELYYDTYNPDTATRQQLKEFDSLTADVIEKGEGVASQAHLQRELE